MEEDDFVDYVLESSNGNGYHGHGNWSQDYLNDLDTSQYDFPNTLWHVKSAEEIAIKTTIFLCIALPGLYLNSVILIILIKNKYLWNPTNYLIANLAFVDFIILLTCPWFALVRDFHQAYVLGSFWCKFEGFYHCTLLLANVGAVILVSYDRLAAATLTAEARVTRSSAPKLIVINWFVSICLSIPWLVKTEYVVRPWRNYLEIFCTEDIMVMSVYWHFVLTFLVWIPLGVMVITYTAIIWRLEWTAKQLSARGGGQAVSRAKGKAMRVTACVLLADVICRVPYSIMVYMRNRNDMSINSVDGPFAYVWILAQSTQFLSCAINPLIYGFTNTRFRKAMDRTPGIACCKFGSWCCICVSFQKKEVRIVDKNTEKIFVIETSPKPEKRLSKMIKNVLHINKGAMDLSVPKVDEGTTKPTKVTPLNV